MYDLIIKRDELAVENFYGFGVEWDPLFWHDFNLKQGVTEADWDLIQKRIKWMEIPIIRMQMLTHWVYKGNNNYDWNSKEMQSLYRHLDICQQEHIPVILTDWGIETWAPVLDIKDTADPKYAEVIGTYLDYLIKKKGYTCIKYFIFVNEPNHELVGWKWWQRWGRWKKGFKQLITLANERNLSGTLKFFGPDTGMAYQIWHKRAVKQISNLIDSYSLHYYGDDHVGCLKSFFLRKKSIKKGQFQKFFEKRWNYVHENDSEGRQKPLITCEIGLNESAEHPIGNRKIGTFWYGLAITDFAIQIVRAGSWSVIAWMLDDTCHEGFYWGMWAGKKENFRLRPWFYPWALLAKLIPPHSIIYQVKNPNKYVRVLTAQVSTESRKGWTFCIVNRANTDISLNIHIPDEGCADFNYFLYSKTEMPKDQDGFPIPKSTISYNFNEKIELFCPSNAIVFLSSVKFP